ncbi:Tafazzin [Vitis vinifera]|uniref:Tafazzin family protein n=1 Tax=Vitis vinifera TaxID=29760 RepID=A0A438HF92_VITVI|nr:Tafazzin [Vitis vinifera]
MEDLWKSRARSLQLRLRDRFRIAVDRHRRLPMFSTDGYFSSTLQRWLRRVRDFRRDSLPSSSAFYRKRVGKDIGAEEDSVFVRMPSSTCGNHVASMDDPLIIASLLPPNVLLDARSLRWTMCATDRCFKNPVTSASFNVSSFGQFLVAMGSTRRAWTWLFSKLNSGGWVHIFPEGSRSRDGGKTMGSAKRGVGRLVLDADNTPIVVPFVHTGMQEVMPIGANFPRIGQANLWCFVRLMIILSGGAIHFHGFQEVPPEWLGSVTVLIGDPIHFDDLLNEEQTQHMSEENYMMQCLQGSAIDCRN